MHGITFHFIIVKIEFWFSKWIESQNLLKTISPESKKVLAKNNYISVAL